MHNNTKHQSIPTVTIDYVNDCPTNACAAREESLSDWSTAGTPDDVLALVETVKLPPKFIKLVQLEHLGKEKVVNECKEENDSDVSDVKVREENCDTALRWIRQEIVAMKEQDKSLLKQFIELRAKILRLRCLLDMNDSFSDASSLTGSTSSLNEQGKSFPVQRLTVGTECTLINTQSISLPSSPQVGRMRLNAKGPLLRIRSSEWNSEAEDDND